MRLSPPPKTFSFTIYGMVPYTAYLLLHSFTCGGTSTTSDGGTGPTTDMVPSSEVASKTTVHAPTDKDGMDLEFECG